MDWNKFIAIANIIIALIAILAFGYSIYTNNRIFSEFLVVKYADIEIKTKEFSSIPSFSLDELKNNSEIGTGTLTRITILNMGKMDSGRLDIRIQQHPYFIMQGIEINNIEAGKTNESMMRFTLKNIDNSIFGLQELTFRISCQNCKSKENIVFDTMEICIFDKDRSKECPIISSNW